MKEIRIKSSSSCTTSESAELLVGYNKALQGKKTVVQWIRNEQSGSVAYKVLCGRINATEQMNSTEVRSQCLVRHI
jgi:hypothetical protein